MKYTIVGAGLSGLTAGFELLKSGEKEFIILEARQKVGGRLDTRNGIDFGATWFQNYHTNLLGLLNELSLGRFDQYRDGESLLVYNSMAAPHSFEMNPDEPSAQRVFDGSGSIAKLLAEKLKDHIQLNTAVHSINEQGDKIEIISSNGHFSADKVILTLPPKLAAEVEFKPSLPLETVAAMKDTHTWMSNSIKVGLTFKKPFWREKDLSGTVISQISPVAELYDHSSADETEFGLMGFVNENTRDESPENRKEQILNYLEKHLGPEIRDFIMYEEKDWSKDEYTATKKMTPVYLHPQYGNPLLRKSYMNEKLYFSGTETSAEYGGYMEGAVISGKEVIRKIL